MHWLALPAIRDFAVAKRAIRICGIPRRDRTTPSAAFGRLPLGAPRGRQAAPDEQLLGKARGYARSSGERLAEHLVASHRPEHLASSFSGGLEALYPHRVVGKGEAASVLARAAKPTLFSYSLGNERLSSDDSLDRQRVTGLLVVKGWRREVLRVLVARDPGARIGAARGDRRAGGRVPRHANLATDGRRG